MTSFFHSRRLVLSFLALGAGAAVVPPVRAAQEYRLSDDGPPESQSGSLFDFSQEGWNQARESVEEEAKPAPSVVPPVPSAPVEAPAGINVSLPYESGLTISGRKLIALKLSQTRRKSAHGLADGVPQSQNDMEMRQELQVRIKGQVGRKITVNVDFDDTKEDKRDISVMYQGDPGEFVQEAAFGDITLSLPSTEFVSFSKQLFGVRTKLQYKNVSLMAIGSRTKGTTETKRFNGATKFERRVIPSSGYFKKQYYSVAFTSRPIVAGSEQIWRDDGDSTNNNRTPITVEKVVQDYDDVSLSTGTGMFDKLKPGDDYTLDASRGILFFKRPVAALAVIAVDYQFADDGSMLSDTETPGVLKLAKTANDAPFLGTTTGTANRREIQTFYSLGNIKLIPDNGSGNFILRTIDTNQNEKLIPLTNGAYLQYASSGAVQAQSNVQVDFDLGIFNIAFSTGRFDPDTYLRVDDPRLYTTTPSSEFSFLTEYKYRLRDFQLRPNIVFGSDRVTVNGRLMRSEIDYFLDTASGLLQFFNENELDENSQIEVTYDYAPFGGQLGQTLVGTRAELAVVPGRLQFGSTFLYTFAPKTTVVPDIRSTPSSLMVLELDGRMSDVSVPFTNLLFSLSGEAAQSRENPNLYGKALVDSMEGVAQEDALVLDSDLWPLGSNPDGSLAPTDPASVTVGEIDMNLDDVVAPDSGVKDNEKLRVLEVSLKDLDGEKSSLMYTFPKGGNRDFSKKIYLEMWLEGLGPAGNGVDLWVNAGRLNEDSDMDGIADTEDTVIEDGTLNAGEDVGYEYNFGTTTFRIGADNGRVDAENGNGGVFRTNDGEFGTPLAKLSNFSDVGSGVTVTDREGNPAPITDLGFSGWRFIRVPLSGVQSNPAYGSVEQVRLTFVSGAVAVPVSTKVRIGKLAFVGNTWESAAVAGGAAMSVGAVNNLDNPEYTSLIGNPAYNDLYGDQAENRTREQALSLSFDLPSGSTASTRSVYGTARDFSHHKTLNYFFSQPAGLLGGTLFVQFGSETDYFEVSRPIGSDARGWVLDSIRLLDQNNDGTPETVQSDVVGSSVTVVGSPSLSRVGQFKIGLRNPTGVPLNGTLWVNEIYVSGARTRIGNARRFAADGKWGKWGTFGGTFRNVDRNFQTLTSPVVNQDREELSGYGSFSRWSFLPLSGNYAHTKTITPAVLQTGQSQLVSVLSEGREENMSVRGDGQFILPKAPALSYSAERAVTESTTNQERRDRNVYTGSFDYALPFRLDLMPGKFSLRPLPDTVFLKYTRTNFFLSYFPERLQAQLSVSTNPVSQSNAIFANARVTEISDEWVGRAGFTPWDGLVITPNYSQRRVTERRDFSQADLAVDPDFIYASAYDKAFNQTRGLAASWRIFPWLEPRINYSLTGNENNGLPSVSSPTASNVKSLDRTASGDLFLNLAPRDIFPKFKFFRSLNMEGSFRVESSDSYSGVPKDYTEWRNVSSIPIAKINRRDGSKMYGLLAPLTFDSPSAQRNQQTARNTLRYALNWSPLDWLKFPYRLEPFKTMNFNNTLTITNEHTENTLTARDVTTKSWPDMILTLRDTEKMLFVERWVGSSQASVRFSRRNTQTFKEDSSESLTRGLDYRFMFLTRYDVFLGVSMTDGNSHDLRTGLLKSTQRSFNDSLQVGTKIGNWRLTPSVTLRSDVSQDGTGRYSQDLQTQSLSILGRFDKSYPGGFRFPFTKRVFSNVNRLTLDTKLGWDRRSSSLNYDRDNTDAYSGEATGEWEISKNFRLSFGGKVGMLNNRAVSQEGSMTLEVNSQLVIQF